MTNDLDQGAGATGISAKYQVLTLVGFAAVAGLALTLLMLASLVGRSASGQAAKPAYFILTSEQASSMRLVKVGLRNFRNQTITDGYVAPNAIWGISGVRPGKTKPGVPVLAGQTADLLQAESDLATAAAQLRTARATEERQHKLFIAEGAALKDWQQSQTDLAAAATSFETARNKLRLLGKSSQELQGTLSPASVTEPLPGRVFTVGDTSLVWFVANLREADASHAHLGDPMDVRVAALPNKVFHLRISYLSAAVDPVTHRLAVAGVSANEDDALKPNMQAIFDISERAGSVAPAVPEAAVIHEGDKARIWIVDKNGRYATRDISAGRSQGGYVEALSGVSAGETIVAGGALFLDQEQSGN